LTSIRQRAGEKLSNSQNNLNSISKDVNYIDDKNEKSMRFRKIFLMIIAVTVHNIPGKIFLNEFKILK
jgi:hypothetical protein